MTTTKGQFIAERDTVTRLQRSKLLPLAFIMHSNNKRVTQPNCVSYIGCCTLTLTIVRPVYDPAVRLETLCSRLEEAQSADRNSTDANQFSFQFVLFLSPQLLTCGILKTLETFIRQKGLQVPATCYVAFKEK